MKKEKIIGWLLLSPFILGFLVVIGHGIYLLFTDEIFRLTAGIIFGGFVLLAMFKLGLVLVSVSEE